MPLYVLILVLVAGKFKGGQVSNLAQLKIRYKWLLFASLIAQLAAIYFRPQISGFDGAIFILSYVGLLVFCLLNMALSGMFLIIAGVFSNFLVISLNGGAMPISPGALEAIGRTHQVVAVQGAPGETPVQIVQAGKDIVNNHSTVLGFLGDEIVLPLLFGFASAISIGDVLLTLGLSWLILKVMFKRSTPEAVPNVNRKVVTE